MVSVSQLLPRYGNIESMAADLGLPVDYLKMRHKSETSKGVDSDDTRTAPSTRSTTRSFRGAIQ